MSFIKRVIELPGDQISIRGEVVFINGKKLDEPYKFLDTDFFAGKDLEITMPKRKYFMIGNNRRNSQDSRFWGFVDEVKIHGKRRIVFWSHDLNQNLSKGYNIKHIEDLLN